ncbi:MAG: hypothetical protein QOJ16_3230 [Acidobacteriota bacterium]|jgi:hypothetical protein|nr:hypothetical protein [Acidobacteriota bacterium]
MSIQEFVAKIESGKERGSLFMALGQLRRLGNLKDLIQAATATTDTGWISWQDMGAESVDGAAIAGA